MKRPLTKKKGDQLPLAEMDPEAFAKAPHTRGFFLDSKFSDDGADRVPGMIMLSCQDSQWTMMLKERASCLQINIGAPTLKDLWKLLEAVLADDNAPWVTDQWAADRRPRARRKST